MIHLKQKLALLIGALLLCLAPAQAAFAADDAAGVAFKVAYSNGRYEVVMQSAATPEEYNITLTAQVTLKVPHGVGADRFEVADVQNVVDGTAWTLTSRVDAPQEDPTADYLSFTVDFPEGNHQAYQWAADQEIKMFSFVSTGTCLGATSLPGNADPFMAPVNSANTNPGNQIDILGLHEGNLFTGVYGSVANCDASAAAITPHNFFLPLVAR